MPPIKETEELQNEVKKLRAEKQELTLQLESVKKRTSKKEDILLAGFEAAADALWYVDIECKEIIVYRDRLLQKLGFTHDEFFHFDSWMQFTFIHPSDRKKVEEALFSKPNEGDGFFNLQLRLQIKEGGYLWIASRGKVLRSDKDNNPIEFAGSFHDISERRTMEEKLWLYSHNLEKMVTERTEEYEDLNKKLMYEVEVRKEAERRIKYEHDRIKNYLDIAGVMMTALNCEGTIFMINARGCEILKLPEEEIIGKNWFDNFIAPDIREKLRTTFLDSFTIGEDELTKVGLYEYRNSIVNAEGETRFIEWRNVLIRDLEGNIIGMLSSGLDITEEQKAQERMRESEERLKEFGDSLDQLLWIAEEDQIVYTSSAIESVWGFSEAAQGFQSYMDIIHPDDKEYVVDIVRRHQLKDFSTSVFEYRILHPKDQSIRWLQTKSFISKNSKKLRLIGITQDITIRKQAEQELLNTLEDSKQLNELRNNFISLISHEIRTPLSIILCSSEYLRKFDDEIDENEKNKYFDRIEHSVDQLVSLIDNVNIINQDRLRAEVKKAEYFDAFKAIRELVEGISTAEKRDILLTFDNSIDTITLYQDKNIIIHLFSNVLTNAVKFTPPDKNISVHVEKGDEFFLFRVVDEGIGIPEDVGKKIFEPFWRASNTKGISGSGLGLSIAAQFAKLIGGNISYESIPGKETSFTVSIPIE